MAGIADAIAAALYPNSAQNSMYTIGGQALGSIQLPTFKKPWQNALAQGLQSMIGMGLQGYGAYSARQANMENAAAMIPQLQAMGVPINDRTAEALTSGNPQVQQLALALTEGQMAQNAAAAKAKAEMDVFREQRGIEFENQKALKQMELDQQRNAATEKARVELFSEADNKRKEINALDETKAFKQANTAYNAMEETAGRDSKAASLFFKKAFERVANPDSVVSPGEMAALQDLQSFYNKQKGKLEGFFGGSDLDPDTRQEMLSIARAYRNAAHDTYRTSAETVLAAGRKRGLSDVDMLPFPFLKAEQLEGTGYKSGLDATQAPLANSGVYTAEQRMQIEAAKAQLRAQLQQRQQAQPAPIAQAAPTPSLRSAVGGGLVQ